jgi:hypothetical protein
VEDVDVDMDLRKNFALKVAAWSAIPKCLLVASRHVKIQRIILDAAFAGSARVETRMD